MKAKNLGFKTVEGLEVKNLETFPSREWGDEGGMKADIYLNGEKVGHFFNAGDGGMPDFYLENGVDRKEVYKAFLDFLKRKDPCYQEGSPYKWLMEKSEPEKVDEDDIFAAVGLIFDKYLALKSAKKILETYKYVGIKENEGGSSLWGFNNKGVAESKHLTEVLTQEEVMAYVY